MTPDELNFTKHLHVHSRTTHTNKEIKQKQEQRLPQGLIVWFVCKLYSWLETIITQKKKKERPIHVN